LNLSLFWKFAFLGLVLSLTGPQLSAIAQDSDESYDPFADYSEFEESAEEEADINFFRNGRFFTVGFVGGYRDFTETMGKIQRPGTSYGLFIAYFFDLRFALQLGFLTGDHRMYFYAPGTPQKLIAGNVGLTSVSVSLKYYLNTQNVTRGLAKLNPYLIGGFSQTYRTTTVSDQPAFGKEGAMGFDVGAGLEVPLMRNMYLGVQGAYQLVSFSDENTQIILADNTKTGLYNKGDIFTVLGIIGLNF
jgi:opacity protein-like surface antigen